MYSVSSKPILGSGKKVAYTGTAGSTSIPASSNSVLLYCSTAAYVAIGQTATTADIPVPANIVIQLAIPKKTGEPITISAIQDASGGNLFCVGIA